MQLKLKIKIEHIGKKLSTDEHNFQPNGQTLTWPKNNKIRKRFPLNKPFSQSNGPDLPYVVVSIITVPSPTHQLPLQILSSFVFGYSGSHHCSSGSRLPSNLIKDKPLTETSSFLLPRTKIRRCFLETSFILTNYKVSNSSFPLSLSPNCNKR